MDYYFHIKSKIENGDERYIFVHTYCVSCISTTRVPAIESNSKKSRCSIFKIVSIELMYTIEVYFRNKSICVFKRLFKRTEIDVKIDNGNYAGLFDAKSSNTLRMCIKFKQLSQTKAAFQY